MKFAVWKTGCKITENSFCRHNSRRSFFKNNFYETSLIRVV